MAPVEEVTELLKDWNSAFTSGNESEVTEILKRLAEVFERETELFLKQDPDPFDQRHPSRSQPDCTLGFMLKQIFKDGKLIDEMVKVYCQRDRLELNTTVCRLMLDILPGLESVVFQEEGFVQRLFHWAQFAPNPLQSYATGLLAPAMEVQEIAASSKDMNSVLVPLMIKKLHVLGASYLQSIVPPSVQQPSSASGEPVEAPFAHLNEESESPFLEPHNSKGKIGKTNSYSRKAHLRFSPISHQGNKHGQRQRSTTEHTEKRSPGDRNSCDVSNFNESSNSNMSELIGVVIGSSQVYPLTVAAQQRYILQYLTPMAEYSELIGHVHEANVLPLVLRYVDLKQNPDARLAFEALKYLASLLCHKKIAIEFVNCGGLQLLLRVPRPSIAATGVSMCLYYLSYIEEAMERICTLPSNVISNLVSYALWLLECSHDSGRCHATMFFGFTFSFRVMLKNFQQQDGLRKMYNVMSTIDLEHLMPRQPLGTISDDILFGNRQTVKTVCSSIKRYFEAQFAALVEELVLLQSKKQHHSLPKQNFPLFKPLSYNVDNIESYFETLIDIPVVPLRTWKAVDEFCYLDGVTLLLTYIGSFFNSTYSSRVELVKNALDILCICSLTAKTQFVFLEKILVADVNGQKKTGMRILLMCAIGEQLKDPDIQLSALRIIINCVSTKPINLEGTKSLYPALVKRKQLHDAVDLLNKMWNSVRTNNGIMVIIRLLSTKSPISSADTFRALACRALCGLARDETVKQIINNLPLFTNAQLLTLMKEPMFLQDKAQHDHVKFCKYGLELIEKVTGAPASSVWESSMLNIKKAEVVAKTKITYEDSQLLQLIINHLASKGFYDTVACLENEMEKLALNPLESPAVTDYGALRDPFKTPRSIRSVSVTGRRNAISCGSVPVAHKNLSIIPPPSVPLSIVVSRKKQPMQTMSPHTRLQKPQDCSGGYYQSPAMRRSTASLAGSRFFPTISLDSIVTEYLRKQHALCEFPVLTCPPFDLYTPHKCPEPQHKRDAPFNSVLRFQKRELALFNESGGYGGKLQNSKLIYSRFRSFRTLRDIDGADDFTVCSFLNFNAARRNPKVLVGKVDGELVVYDLNTGDEEMRKACHNTDINHIESSHNANIIITCDTSRNGHSNLWKLTDRIELIHHFQGYRYMEFGKTAHQDKIIATINDSTASIVDTMTCAELQKFSTEDIGNNYSIRNRATSDHAEELLLSDGWIFDIRSGKPVHKLDKFNAIRNGCFHPNGREIISNSEVWDKRTFKLLRTVSALDQCIIKFNPSNDVIYGVYADLHIKVGDDRAKSLSVIDAHNYSNIATLNLRKKPICFLATDLYDNHVATIEQTASLYSNPEETPLISGDNCICRLYQLGRTKLDGEEGIDVSEESEDETDDDGGGDNLDDYDDDDDDDNNSDDDSGSRTLSSLSSRRSSTRRSSSGSLFSPNSSSSISSWATIDMEYEVPEGNEALEEEVYFL